MNGELINEMGKPQSCQFPLQFNPEFARRARWVSSFHEVQWLIMHKMNKPPGLVLSVPAKMISCKFCIGKAGSSILERM
jgi:hypothetical protein